MRVFNSEFFFPPWMCQSSLPYLKWRNHFMYFLSHNLQTFHSFCKGWRIKKKKKKNGASEVDSTRGWREPWIRRLYRKCKKANYEVLPNNPVGLNWSWILRYPSRTAYPQDIREGRGSESLQLKFECGSLWIVQ